MLTFYFVFVEKHAHWSHECKRSLYYYKIMLWFKFMLGLKFFELVSILFGIVPDYSNEYTTKENKN